MAKLVWTKRSIADLVAIEQYIAANSPLMAKRFIRKIKERTRILQRLPLSGELIAEPNSFELRQVLCGNYRIIYQASQTYVAIITVYHSTRLFDNED